MSDEQLEQAIMEAIVGPNPVEYSSYGRNKRDKLRAAIDVYVADREAAARIDELELLPRSVKSSHHDCISCDDTEHYYKNRVEQLRQEENK